MKNTISLSKMLMLNELFSTSKAGFIQSSLQEADNLDIKEIVESLNAEEFRDSNGIGLSMMNSLV